MRGFIYIAIIVLINLPGLIWSKITGRKHEWIGGPQ